ncbi:MAG: lumazine-binding protein [Mycobacterium sp.]|nr:lumazine-binding protein [Mycobacterium sp.]
MTESEPAAAGDSSSAMPILIALGVVVIAVLAITGLRVLRGDEVRAEAGVDRAVVGQNDALQRQDYADFVGFTCVGQQSSAAAVLGEQRRSSAANGARIVDDVRDPVIDGDRATATVVYHFENSADDKITTEMTFARENGQWKVCSPGPR